MDAPLRCPRCGKLLAFSADHTGYWWWCHTEGCANNPRTVTTLLDADGRPTNMRGWRKGLSKKGKP